MFLEKEPVPKAGQHRFDLQADHEAPAPVFHEGGIPFQFRLEIRAELRRMGEQMLLFDDVQDGDGRRAGDMVTAEGRSQEAVGGLDSRADQDGADGLPPASPFAIVMRSACTPAH